MLRIPIGYFSGVIVFVIFFNIGFELIAGSSNGEFFVNPGRMIDVIINLIKDASMYAALPSIIFIILCERIKIRNLIYYLSYSASISCFPYVVIFYRFIFSRPDQGVLIFFLLF